MTSKKRDIDHEIESLQRQIDSLRQSQKRPRKDKPGATYTSPRLSHSQSFPRQIKVANSNGYDGTYVQFGDLYKDRYILKTSMSTSLNEKGFPDTNLLLGVHIRFKSVTDAKGDVWYVPEIYKGEYERLAYFQKTMWYVKRDRSYDPAGSMTCTMS